MNLTGNIENADYWNMQNSMPLQLPGWHTGARYAFYLLLAGLNLFVLTQFASQPMLAAALITLLSVIAFTAFNQWISSSAHKAHMETTEFFNIGPASFHLGDEAIEFQGTSFSCSIPYASLAAVKTINASHFLLFNTHSAFVLPRSENIEQGDITQFLEAVEQRIFSSTTS